MPRVAVCEAINEPLKVQEVDLADPKAGEVRIRTAAAGVCHSDLSVQNGTLPQAIPAVLGHEGAGIVDAVGPGVEDLEEGDHVVVSWVPQCGHCYFCTRGQGELCEAGTVALMTGGLLDGTPRFSRNGEPLLHMASTGMFSEATVVPAIAAVKIDPTIPLHYAALIGCGVLTGFGAAVNTADIRADDTVVVLGCGGVGLNTIQGASRVGAGHVVAIDMLDSKLALAEEFGATEVVNPKHVDPLERVHELTAGRGADVVFEVIGLKQTMQQALELTRRGGQTVMVGVPDAETILEIPAATDLFFMERRVLGCLYGGSNVHRDVPKLAELYQEGKLKLDELISAEIGLDDVNDAFRAMEKGEVTRSVIRFD